MQGKSLSKAFLQLFAMADTKKVFLLCSFKNWAETTTQTRKSRNLLTAYNEFPKCSENVLLV